jgi:hypothetical protein
MLWMSGLNATGPAAGPRRIPSKEPNKEPAEPDSLAELAERRCQRHHGQHHNVLIHAIRHAEAKIIPCISRDCCQPLPEERPMVCAALDPLLGRMWRRDPDALAEERYGVKGVS